MTNTTLSRVRVEGAKVLYTLRVNAIDLALAAGLIEDAKTRPAPKLFTAGLASLRDYLSPRLIVYENGRPCRLESFELGLESLPKQVEVRLGFGCPSPVRRLLIQYLAFYEMDPAHASIGRLVAGNRKMDFVLNLKQPEKYQVGPLPGNFGVGHQHIPIPQESQRPQGHGTFRPPFALPAQH